MHYSVLLKEAIELLNIKSDGIYVDGTFGRGGHTRAILEKLGVKGKLIACDKDNEAINFGRASISDSRLTLIHGSFANLNTYLTQLEINDIDGILLDLGVSSPQLDTASRGFSFRLDSDLDMRMDNTQGVSCKEWINTVSEEQLRQILWQFGEEKFSRQIARNIVAKRTLAPITTTTQLAKVIVASVPIKENGHHPATRSFQAIRIFLNNELGDLQALLNKLPNLLKIGARVVIISFHSLEDKIVKKAFNALSQPKQLPKWVTVTAMPAEYRVIAKKVRASSNELLINNRSRSAILRCLERIDKLATRSN